MSQFLDVKQLSEVFGYKASRSLRGYISTKKTFPKPIKNSKGINVFNLDDVNAWLKNNPKEEKKLEDRRKKTKMDFNDIAQKFIRMPRPVSLRDENL